MDQESTEINLVARPTRAAETAAETQRYSETAVEIGELKSAATAAKSSGEEAGGLDGEDKLSSRVIDVKGGDFVGGSQRACRICHLSRVECGKSWKELVDLGCRCKGELGAAHSHCAEAWFRVRGSRLCEICGEPVKNINVVCDDRIIELPRSVESVPASSSSARRCLNERPLCFLIMACLVIAFVLPWFFRVSMF